MKTKWVWLLSALLSVGTMAADKPAVNSNGETPDSPPDSTAEIGVQSARDSGIRNGCVRSTSIKRVNFTDNDSGIIDLAGGRQVLVTLRTGCSGIRNEGYVHKPVNGQFCEGDLLRVIHFGSVCVVDKIQPYVAAAQQ